MRQSLSMVQTAKYESMDAQFHLSEKSGHMDLMFEGTWNKQSVPQVDAALRALARAHPDIKHLNISFRDIQAVDTVGAWAVRRVIADFEAIGAKVKIVKPSQRLETLLKSIKDVRPEAKKRKKRTLTARIAHRFDVIGQFMHDVTLDVLRSLGILGAVVRGAQLKPGRRNGVRFSSIIHHLEVMAVHALPIVLLMSVIIGAIIAQQGAFQLKYFGAEIFVVDLVGILVLREIGVLLTAIMVAGRTGSAITAEIGSMRMREEIDALRVMGLSPIGVLVLPRLLALVIALPLLTIIANFAALAGAALVTFFYSDIGFGAFFTRLNDATDLTSVFAGLIKAPFMALIIGIVAALEGLKVGGSAESLGKHVTASVVKAIFVVIVVDGIFAMFYAAINF